MKTVKARHQTRYGCPGVHYNHTFLAHAFGIYQKKGWCTCEEFQKIFTPSQYKIIWEN